MFLETVLVLITNPLAILVMSVGSYFSVLARYWANAVSKWISSAKSMLTLPHTCFGLVFIPASLL